MKPEDARSIPDQITEIPPYPEVSFIKAPYLQWPTAQSVFLLAETIEETPLHIVLTGDDTEQHFVTMPFQPDFNFLTAPMPGLDGWFHQVELPVPDGETQFSLSIVNAPDYHRDVVLPQSLESFVMVAFGDTRSNTEKHQMVSDLIATENPLVVLHSGDLMSSGLEVSQWNEFFDIESALLTNSFYLPVFGNHELGGETYYYGLFETGNNFHSERNWVADLGQVVIIGVEQYTTHWNYNVDGQFWLEENLKKYQDRPWLFFSHHEPMYTWSSHGPWMGGREVVQPLLEQYGVDMVISGHNHCYERFEVNGIQYIVSGGGGAPLYSTGSGPEEEYDIAMNWGKLYHYLRMEISPETVKVTVIDAEEQTVFEEFTLE